MEANSTNAGTRFKRILPPDSRNYKTRFLQALPPCALFFFIYMFFGPLELIQSNANLLGFGIIDALPWYAGAFIALTLLSSAFAALLPGSLFDDATSLVFALSIMSYIQCNILNPDFGRQDGHQIEWTSFPKSALLNILFWLFCIAVIWVLRALLKKHWPKMVAFVSGLMILMQMVGLGWLVADGMSKQKEEGIPFRFSLEDQLCVSKNQNILMFCLDAFSNRRMQEMLEEYPDTLDMMHDFTYYDNCAPIFYGTFPSVISTLTGTETYDANASYKDFEREAWQGEKADAFYAMLKENNFNRCVYNDESYISYSYELLEGKIDNAVPISVTRRIDAGEMFRRIGYLTLFRYFPLGLKACYWSSMDEYKSILKQDEWPRWDCMPALMYESLEKDGLTLSEKNQFSIYHFWGAHLPYYLGADCRFTGKIIDEATDQCRGHFTMLEKYFEELREQDIYDDAMIVVFADHGDYSFSGHYAANSTIMLVKMPGERHDTLQYNSAPVTHLELLPTIASVVDEESAAAYGSTLSEIPDAPRMRKLWRFLNSSGKPGYDAFGVFEYDCNIDELTDLETPDVYIPLYDSYY